jgi:hypothetical protein
MRAAPLALGVRRTAAELAIVGPGAAVAVHIGIRP